MAIAPDSIFLDSADGGTLQAQIKRQIVGHILSGQFRAGDKLPSSRALAQHLGISRITVTIAYSDLVADDYITAKGRSGYFVSDSAPEAQAAPALLPRDSVVDWSRYFGQRMVQPTITRPQDWRSYRYPFIYGQTDPKLFDHRNWRLCAMQALGQRDFNTLATDQYTDDDPLLVDYIRRHILTRRGVNAAPETILVTLGAQNALWLTAQILLTQRRVAAMENPGYPGLRDILETTRCHVSPVPVDAGGLQLETLPETLDVLYTTVSHQSPTNVTMPMERRRALLDLAAERQFVIVEDDYEFELTFESPAQPSLKSLDAGGSVIHIGSFSKSLFPGLRLGFLVAPEPFVREARALRATVLRHPPGAHAAHGGLFPVAWALFQPDCSDQGGLWAPAAGDQPRHRGAWADRGAGAGAGRVEPLDGRARACGHRRPGAQSVCARRGHRTGRALLRPAASGAAKPLPAELFLDPLRTDPRGHRHYRRRDCAGLMRAACNGGGPNSSKEFGSEFL